MEALGYRGFTVYIDCVNFRCCQLILKLKVHLNKFPAGESLSEMPILPSDTSAQIQHGHRNLFSRHCVNAEAKYAHSIWSMDNLMRHYTQHKELFYLNELSASHSKEMVLQCQYQIVLLCFRKGLFTYESMHIDVHIYEELFFKT